MSEISRGGYAVVFSHAVQPSRGTRSKIVTALRDDAQFLQVLTQEIFADLQYYSIGSQRRVCRVYLRDCYAVKLRCFQA